MFFNKAYLLLIWVMIICSCVPQTPGNKKNTTDDQSFDPVQAPQSIQLLSSAQQRTRRPTIRVAGVAERSRVTLFSDSRCFNAIASGTVPRDKTHIDFVTPELQDGTYFFHATQQFGVEPESPCSTRFLRYELDASANRPSAVSLQDPTTYPSPIRTPTLRVFGVDDNAFVTLYTDANCTNQVGSANAIGSSATITTNRLEEGIYRFYARQVDARRNISECSIANQEYEVSAQSLNQVSRIELAPPNTTSPVNTARPIIRVSGVTPGAAVELYSDDECRNGRGQATATSDIIEFSTVELPNGSHTLYVRQRTSDGNFSTCSSEQRISLSFVVDTIAPNLRYIGNPSSREIGSGPVTFDVEYSGADTISLAREHINTFTLSGNISIGTIEIENVSGFSSRRRIRLDNITGDGSFDISVDSNTAKDNANNSANGLGKSLSVKVDNTNPSISISPPSSIVANKDRAINYEITYENVDSNTDTVDLQRGHISFTSTGSVTSNPDYTLTKLSFSRYRITLNNMQGDGTTRINIVAGTASDNAGNTASNVSSTSVTIDNTPPNLFYSSGLSVTRTTNGPVSFNITYTGADTINLFPRSINQSVVSGNPQVGLIEIENVSESVRRVVLSQITGDGIIKFSVKNSTGLDAAGNASQGLADSDELRVDNNGPTLAIGPPSRSSTNNQVVSYVLTYSDADSIDLDNGHITLLKTGTANASTTTTSIGSNQFRVDVISITGDGTLGIQVAEDTASDNSGNTSAGGVSQTFSVDNTAPTIAYSFGPSPSLSTAGPITFEVEYSGADEINLEPNDVQFVSRSGNINVATKSVQTVSGDTNLRRIVLSDITGTGSGAIQIASATASDSIGNTAQALGQSPEFTIDNDGPGITISNPSTNLTRSGPVTYLVTYSNADEINLEREEVNVVTSSGDAAAEIVEVTTISSTQKQITLRQIVGDGTLHITIDPNTARDSTGNFAPGATSNSFDVDNTPPTIAITGPFANDGSTSIEDTINGPVKYLVEYTGFSTTDLDDSKINVVPTDPDDENNDASATATVTGSGANYVIELNNFAGEGLLQVEIASNTAIDEAGNTSPEITSDPILVTRNTSVVGRILYQYVPATSNSGLNYDATENRPVRRATVNLVNASNDAVQSTTRTLDDGTFALSTEGAEGAHYIEVVAEVREFNYQVLDNTNENAIYSVNTTNFIVEDVDEIDDFLITSGWSGPRSSGGYNSSQRLAAPFAIMDTIYTAISEMVAVRPAITFPRLDVHWSPLNRPEVDDNGSIDYDLGFISTSHYTSSRFYILGFANSDTDEYDSAIVAHEWGHYFEDRVSRSDSLGGGHFPGMLAEPTLAFSEAWASAMAAIILDDPEYLDTAGLRQQTTDLNVNAETGVVNGETAVNPGWYSEISNLMVIYDIMDQVNDSGDSVNIGLGPVLDAFLGPIKTTTASSTIFPFITALKDSTSEDAAITNLLSNNNIEDINDIYGDSQTDDPTGGAMLPVHINLTVGGASATTFLTPVRPDSWAMGFQLIRFTATDTEHIFRVSGIDDEALVMGLFKQGDLLFDNDLQGNGASADTTLPNLVPGDEYRIILLNYRPADRVTEGAWPNYDQITLEVLD